MSSSILLRLFGAHEAADANAKRDAEKKKLDEHHASIALLRKKEEDYMTGAKELNDDVFAFIKGESPPQRLSPKMKFAEDVHKQFRNEGDVFGGKRRSKSHRKASHRKSHRKACRKASHRKASHRKACHRRH